MAGMALWDHKVAKTQTASKLTVHSACYENWHFLFIQFQRWFAWEPGRVWISYKCKLQTRMLHTHESISLFHLYNVTCSSRGENAARSVHWTDQPGGQKIARHNGWEGEGRRNWEETVCLHSTSLPLHWRNARSKQSLKLLNKLEPLTTASLIYYAYLLSTLFVSITGMK